MGIVATAAILLEACSGGHARATPSTRSTSAPITAAGSAVPSTPGSVDSGTPTVNTVFTGAGSGQFCDLQRSDNEKFKQLISSSNDPAALRDLFRGISSALDQAAALAPPEIKPDMIILAAAYKKELASLESVGFDLTRLPADDAAVLQQPDVQAASARSAAYSMNVCHIS